ncbi:hypothetical protein GCM10011575_00900 [Microlunatus endophyticus]|uniref:Uncharacterized protein n=1 Tax=Microlunatus endophyticus TaxID=1716077 RepID=A0A917W0B9_9ACTN|nr:hypothetical protein GCM10011575_00900 [Microlunatus endophyticus]
MRGMGKCLAGEAANAPGANASPDSTFDDEHLSAPADHVSTWGRVTLLRGPQ